MIKILYVISGLNQSNGVTSFVYNYVTKMDMTKFDVTIAAYDDRTSEKYMTALKEKGVKVVLFPPAYKVNSFKYYKLIKEFFKENHDFDIVHCNIVNVGFFYLSEAKRYNIPVRILHAHATKLANTFLKNLRNNIVAVFTKKLATHYFACSEAAGKSLFKNKQYTVIRNAIDKKVYCYNEEHEREIKEKLHIDKDSKVVGFVGRIGPPKNPFFAVKIFEDVCARTEDFACVMAGFGPQFEELKSVVEASKYKDRIFLLGEIDYVHKLYSAIDTLIMPSFNEGEPVVGIEAQFYGIKCLFSSNINKGVAISQNANFVSLDDLSAWSDLIIANGKTTDRNVTIDARYDIYKSVSILQLQYENMLSE